MAQGSRPSIALGDAARRLAGARVPPVEDLGRLYYYASRSVRGKVVKYLLANLEASGLKVREGKLRKAVESTRVYVRNGVLVWSFTKETSDEVHAQGNALNYGAVRQPRVNRQLADLPSNNAQARFVPGYRGRYKPKDDRAGLIGRRAKKTLKKQLLGNAGQSHRADAWRSGGTNRARLTGVSLQGRQVSQNIKSKSLSVPVQGGGVTGHVTVTRPRYFFDLTGAQIADVMQDLARYIAARIERRATARGGD